MKRFLNASLAGLILTTGLALTTPVASFAQDHRYHDKKHKDDHEWNDQQIAPACLHGTPLFVKRMNAPEGQGYGRHATVLNSKTLPRSGLIPEMSP